MKKKLNIVAVMIVLSLAIIACGNSSKNDSKSNKKKKHTVEKESTDDETVKDKKKKEEAKEEAKDEPKEEKEVAESEVEEAPVMESKDNKGAKQAPEKEVVCNGPDNRNAQFYEVPEGTTRIAKEAFYGCNYLDEVNIPNSVKYIDYRAFSFCNALNMELVLPDNIVEIGKEAFEHTRFYGVIKPNNTLTTIGDGAFRDIEITEVVIPESVDTMGVQVFEACHQLKSAVIKANIDQLPDATFVDCENLETVEIPDNLFYIGSASFRRCRSLTNIVLPSNLKHIGDFAFEDCNLSELVLPEGLEIIGEQAFKNNNNLTITLPSTITEIGNDAFEGVKCIRVPQAVLDRFSVRADGFQKIYAYGIPIEVID